MRDGLVFFLPGIPVPGNRAGRILVPDILTYKKKIPGHSFCIGGREREMKGSVKYSESEHENTGPVLAVTGDTGHFAA